MLQSLITLYTAHFGHTPEQILPLPGAGSARRYFRLSSPAGSAVGVLGPDPRENETFISLARAFAGSGAPVPEFFGVTPDFSAYLQQDLGDRQLLPLLPLPEGKALVREVMHLLPQLQLCPQVTDEMLYPVKRMEARHVMADLNYFKYCLLKAAGVEPDEELLEKDFQWITREVERTPESLCGLMLRDCQSRNVMVKDARPYFIDFQSARRGPLLYDVASFLWQARAGFDAAFRREMTGEYISALAKLRPIDEVQARESLKLMVLIRTLQVLGAYGLRGLTQRKAHFLASLPPAMKNLRELLASGDYAHLPELSRCLSRLVEVDRFRESGDASRLNVTVFSFSYKKGYPDDFTGNGGGFMFDCRAMHNPGRYDRYKPLTGLDREVIDFLEERGEVQPFLQAASSLVLPAVERYLERGFTHLQVGFGCTGGRHRSVYCAEHLAAIIRSKFPESQVRVKVIHREQQIEKSK